MISILVPYHDMDNAEFFLKRNIDSIMSQTYKNYEIVLTKDGKMAENINSAIRRAKGDLIKILFLDDYFAHPNALQDIVDNFKGGWLVTGTDNNKYPYYTEDTYLGNNKLGSPSALTFENKDPLLFDETMTWLLDCDYYKRLFTRYGEPSIIDGINVCIGCGVHQSTHLLSEELKTNEHNYMLKKYE